VARNKSEKIPHPELHADVHRYYAARFGASGEGGTRVFDSLSTESKNKLSRIWWGPMHKILTDFYKEQRRAKEQ